MRFFFFFAVLLLLRRINTFGRRMINLTSHLIKQRCFYPLYPADDDVNVDIELLYKNGMMNVKPDILILPSNFHFFAEVNIYIYIYTVHTKINNIGLI